MFLTHKSSLQENSYIPLAQYNNRNVIVKKDQAISLISNVCTHQHSIISTKMGFGSRVCPFHGWAFDIIGNPLTSGRTGHYCKNETKLESTNVYEWNSLIFSEEVNFEIDIDFSNMKLYESRTDIVSSPFNIIMDLFLDVDHIESVHAGVYNRIGLSSIRDVDWKFYKNGSVQTVRKSDNTVGAVWAALFPYTMIEWQSGGLFITVAIPGTNNTSKVFVFKYADKDCDNDLAELNDRVWEEAWSQDKHQAEIIDKFSDSNIEIQKIYFRDFLRNNGINKE